MTRRCWLARASRATRRPSPWTPSVDVFINFGDSTVTDIGGLDAYLDDCGNDAGGTSTGSVALEKFSFSPVVLLSGDPDDMNRLIEEPERPKPQRVVVVRV